MQEKSNDCGVACIAMIINKYVNCPQPKAYSLAKNALFGDEPASYTGVKDLRRALRHFGIDIGKQRYPFKKISKTDMGLSFDAIIGTQPNHNGYWHWLVWDASNRRLIDPNPKKKGFGHRSASHYVKVLSEGLR
ncbi:cysteine peptidase family C39 domain-containing protein [Paracoccus sp. YLB-12]|uniref:Cysteine peptidase family C39 domain-containing protein n=1 Tax=Paracoccus maritimus TaxID=2933292 RepID=A0ABT2KDN0_9RHOB|nr:cysteine peptidase family C39 domain-containing protein [Paracoccus sp. YLB-12]MCT4334644.1 cysteine peptidase family C39 domain-containing protein [Paracoccus sp. YLB-12]